MNLGAAANTIGGGAADAFTAADNFDCLNAAAEGVDCVCGLFGFIIGALGEV